MIVANHQFQVRGLNVRDENGNEGCAACGRGRDFHPPVPSKPDLDDLARQLAGAAETAPAAPASRSPAASPRDPSTAIVDRAEPIPGPWVDAALAAAIARQGTVREAVWFAPSHGQVRAMLEAVAPLIGARERARAEAAEALITEARAAILADWPHLVPSRSGTAVQRVLAIIIGSGEVDGNG